MKITVALKLMTATGQFPSITMENMRDAVYDVDTQSLLVFDMENQKRAIFPWGDVLYCLYDDYPPGFDILHPDGTVTTKEGEPVVDAPAKRTRKKKVVVEEPQAKPEPEPERRTRRGPRVRVSERALRHASRS